MKKLLKSEMPAYPGIILRDKKSRKKAVDRAMRTGSVFLDVYHDDWCAAIIHDDGKQCNCKPTLVARDLRLDKIMRLPMGMFEWRT